MSTLLATESTEVLTIFLKTKTLGCKTHTKTSDLTTSTSGFKTKTLKIYLETTISALLKCHAYLKSL